MCTCDFCEQKTLELVLGMNGNLPMIYWQCTNPECLIDYGNSFTTRVNKIVKLLSKDK